MVQVQPTGTFLKVIGLKSHGADVKQVNNLHNLPAQDHQLPEYCCGQQE